jgi:hypothetical protein
MRRVNAKIQENGKEDPASEPDKDPNTWLIEAKLDEDVIDWETVHGLPGFRDQDEVSFRNKWKEQFPLTTMMPVKQSNAVAVSRDTN